MPREATAVLRTSPGVVREHNEDSAHADEGGRFFVVADGMGGCNAGDVASSLAVGVVRMMLETEARGLDDYAVSPSPDGRAWIRGLLERAVRTANAAVVRVARADKIKHGMGTTLDVLVVVGNEAFVAHVGDGRVYLVRDGKARQETADHTMAQAMLKAGAMSEDEAEGSVLRSVLSNSIGGEPEVHVGHGYVKLRRGDRLLLCTDGLYEYFSPDEIAERVSDAPADAALDLLIANACERGGEDNITGILIDVDATAAPMDEIDDAITTPIFVPVEPVRQAVSGS